MTDDVKLTEPQRLMLLALRHACDRTTPSGEPAGWASPRQMAMMRWPESPGWRKRARMHGGHQGAVGGTMPMKAAAVLWRLHERGMAWCGGTNKWSITERGRRWLEAHASAQLGSKP